MNGLESAVCMDIPCGTVANRSKYSLLVAVRRTLCSNNSVIHVVCKALQSHKVHAAPAQAWFSHESSWWRNRCQQDWKDRDEKTTLNISNRWNSKLHIWPYRFGEFLCLWECRWTAPGERLDIQFSSSQFTAMHEGRRLQLATIWPALPTAPRKRSCHPPAKMCREQNYLVQWGRRIEKRIRYSGETLVIFIVSASLQFRTCHVQVKSMWVHLTQSSHSSFHMSFLILYSMYMNIYIYMCVYIYMYM